MMERPFIVGRVACNIVELSTMPVEGRIAVLWWEEERSILLNPDVIYSHL